MGLVSQPFSMAIIVVYWDRSKLKLGNTFLRVMGLFNNAYMCNKSVGIWTQIEF